MTNEETMLGLTKEQIDARIRERGSASDLVGIVTVTDVDGNPIPLLDDEGYEILGIATGEKYSTFPCKQVVTE